MVTQVTCAAPGEDSFELRAQRPGLAIGMRIDSVPRYRSLLALAGTAVLAGIGPCGHQEELRAQAVAVPAAATLEVTYDMAGGQELGEATVQEEDDRVTVRLRTAPCSGSDCTTDDVQLWGCVRLELERPLGSREVLDASTGEPVSPDPPGVRPPTRIPCEPPP